MPCAARSSHVQVVVLVDSGVVPGRRGPSVQALPGAEVIQAERSVVRAKGHEPASVSAGVGLTTETGRLAADGRGRYRLFHTAAAIQCG